MKNTAALLLGVILAIPAGAQQPPTIPPPPAEGEGTTRTVPRRQFPTRPQQADTATPTLPAPVAPAAAQPTPPAITPPPGVVPATPSTALPPQAAGAVNNGANGAAAGLGADGEEEATIRFSSPGLPLEQVLDEYFKLVRKIPIRGGQGSPLTVNPELKIPLKTPFPLTRSQAIVFLETALGMNGVTLVAVDDTFVKVVPDAGVAQAGGEFSKLGADQLPSAGAVVQQIVQLKYVAMEEVLSAITPFAKTPASIIQIPSTQTLVLRDYTENVKRMLELIERIDVISELEVKPEIVPIKYALAADIANVIGTLTPSGAGTVVGQTSRTGTTGGVRSGGLGGGAAGGFGGGGGVGGFGGQSRGGVTTQQQGGAGGLNRAATGLAGATTFQNNLQRLVQRAAGSGQFQILGNVQIIADERTNSLLVFASNTDMVMVKSIIDKLDVVLAQVLIESIIMEVSLNKNFNMGVSAGQKPRTSGNFTGVGGGNNGGFFGIVTNVGAGFLNSLPSGAGYSASWGDDLDIAVQAVAGDGTINVLSRPRVQTSHAVPASLSIGEQYPFVTGTITDINGGARSQYQQTFIGITLDILPLINPDGLVVMDIAQDIQQRGTDVQIDGNPVPTTTQRAATAKVAVRDREVVILGGFIRNDRNASKSGVPFLKDIPFLGAAFRSSNKNDVRTEMMVLIKPTVLKTPEAASLAAMEEKDKMPAIRQAEAEARAEARKREQEADREIARKLGLRPGS